MEQSPTLNGWRSACLSCRAWRTANGSPEFCPLCGTAPAGEKERAQREGQPQSLQSLPDREPEKEAVLLAGHGTGHPADSLYSLMARVLEKDHRNVFLGTMEGFPGLSEMVAELKSLGTRKVRLLPFLLVAGGHAENDIAGAAPESWKSTLVREGFEVEVHLRGLGEMEGIVSILLEHTRSALLKMEEGK